MRTIHRYEIPIDGYAHQIDAPPATNITRAVARPDHAVEFWAEVDTDAERIVNEYQIVGTGHEVPEGFHVVATADRRDGLVWHLAARFKASARYA